MIYIFEDDERDILSVFFKKAYSNDISDKFIYAKANGYLYQISNEILQTTKEIVIVFFDMFPGNKELINAYGSLI